MISKKPMTLNMYKIILKKLLKDWDCIMRINE